MRPRPAVNSERVLVLAPTLMDAALSQSILAEAGLTCHLCPDPDKLGLGVREGVGAILLTEEPLAAGDAQGLAEALRGQEPWSDIPILLLSAAGADSSLAAYAMELLGNVTVLERPVRIMNLVSALRAALRARRRQYELRDRLAELEQAEASLRNQSERLRLLWEAASVLLTTEQPDAMMQALFAKIAPHFGLDCYFNFIPTEAGDALRLQSCSGIPEDAVHQLSRLEFGQAVCGTVALRRQPVVATDIQRSDDPMVQLVKTHGIRAYACNPLLIEDRLLGTLSFASRQKDRFTSEELEFLQTICHYVTIAYERVHLINRLRDADRRKNEFLATLAHELRNPLAPIRNALQIIQLTDYSGGAAEQARGIMERQLRQMVRLIDDLLDVSRISRGKLELRKERIELAAVIRSAIDIANPLIEASGHRLTVGLPTLPVYLNADSLRLAQVFSNLLNNAAKYMDRGGHIEITGIRHENEVVVTVRDTGIGISAEALSSIFEMFTQVDRSLERSQGGLGIGLTLVKKLVEMHEGRVEARSDGPGQGAEFIVRLPIASGPSAAASLPAGIDGGKASPAKYRILVADDNVDAAESLSMMLRLGGHEVRTVHNGAEAVEAAAAFRPDVVLLDIGMPQLNGYEVARRIRAQPWGQAMKLIALTGWGQEEDKRRAAQAGFDQHYTKPVKPTELEQFLARHAVESSGPE